MQIELIDDDALLTDDQTQLIESLLKLAGEKEQVASNSELSVTIVRDEEIQAINKAYRNIDEPTDVISFEMQDGMDDLPPDVQAHVGNVLGDIIISIDRAKDQATEYNHSLDREVGFLAVHGFLHLLGYTHGTTEEEQSMFLKQTEILDAHGLQR